MSSLHLQALLTSRTRAALVAWAVESDDPRTMRELSTALGFSVPQVQAEVRRLAALGLVRVERRGGVDFVRPVRGPVREAFKVLAEALHHASETNEQEDLAVRGELVALGAPLLDPPSPRSRPPEEVLLDGLELARRDPTVLRVLPVVLARLRHRLDWNRLRELARQRRQKAALGMLVTLTAELTGDEALTREAEPLRDHRRRRVESFFEGPQTVRARQLADARTPAPVREWNFLMNMDLEDFRRTLERHG